MDGERVLRALRAESERLFGMVSGIPEPEWDRPSPCPPWTVRDVLAHVTTVVGRVGSMLAEPEPPRSGLVTAVGYYAPDHRFSPGANSARVESAREASAAHRSGQDLAELFDSTWRLAVDRCEREPEGRVVRTRHGDPMLLSQFLVTRVFEVCVHGFDIAEGLGHGPWATEEAQEVVTGLLLDGVGSSGHVPPPGMECDRTTFLRKATGRLPMSAAERLVAERGGLRRLALG
ncbi:maleylpyruvate isomerase N-terminal domain-containing protein [Streptomyces sp. GC420]|uniref:maleylpyruvate isomerase N-terminal domain-containing protein n=1 Tax=Streptomyces sp. GC420 TaxID=2697568 RepID=UPI00141523BF|nr:maleylpyruvate isomerase N-terminal domain-containing protein [Streptomyces sp. GC420]NBM17536.1 maleylpyruvate isomerase family mycothiol-dependent enzyme [Streptomyces sp. GC420]